MLLLLSGKDKIMDSAEVRLTPMAVFWDIENCKVPKDSHIEDISKNIRKTLSTNPAVDSATIQAYGAISVQLGRDSKELESDMLISSIEEKMHLISLSWLICSALHMTIPHLHVCC